LHPGDDAPRDHRAHAGRAAPRVPRGGQGPPRRPARLSPAPSVGCPGGGHRAHRGLDRPGPAQRGLARDRARSAMPHGPSAPSTSVPSTPWSGRPAAELTFVATPVGAVAERGARRWPRHGWGGHRRGQREDPDARAVHHPRFVGGHPMAGSEQEGVDGADPDLFEGRHVGAHPGGRHRRRRLHPGPLGGLVLRRRGGRVEPARHDQLVAVVSHVPHLTAAVLMGLADERAEEHRALLRLAAGGFRDMTRIAAGHPGIWPDICAENRDAIVEELDAFIVVADLRCATWWSPPGTASGSWRARAGPHRPHQPARPHRPGPGDLAELRVPIPTGRARWPRSPRWPPSSCRHRRSRDRPLGRGRPGRADPPGGGRRRPNGCGAAWWPAATGRRSRPGVTVRRRRPCPTRYTVEPLDGAVDVTMWRAGVEEHHQPGPHRRRPGRVGPAGSTGCCSPMTPRPCSAASSAWGWACGSTRPVP
jgi:hypothetical protein